MLKLLGAGAVVISCTLAGLFITERRSRRVKDLSSCILAVRGIRNELKFSMATPEQIVNNLVAMGNLEHHPLLLHCLKGCREGRPFPQSWEQAAKEGYPDFEEPERRILLSVGQILGGSDAASQEDALSYCTTQLEEIYQDARDKLKTQAHLYNTLGVLSGLLIAVLLY